MWARWAAAGKLASSGTSAVIAVHQHAVEIALDGGDDLGRARRIVLGDEHVAHRGDDRDARRRRLRRRDERQQLEAEGAPAEGKALDEQDVRLHIAERREDERPPPRAEGVVDRPSVGIDDRLEAGIGGARRRELHGGEGLGSDARLGRAAGENGNVEAARLHRTGDRSGAPPMSDAEQMLDMEEDAAPHRGFRGRRPRLKRSGAGRPARSISKRWTACQSSRAGALPRMSQPVARARRARITPL